MTAHCLSNSEHEIAVLCSFIFDKELAYKINSLDVDDFFFEENKEIFLQIKNLLDRDQKISKNSLCAYLGQDHQRKSLQLVIKLSDRHMSCSYLDELIVELKRLERFRRAHDLIRSGVAIFSAQEKNVQSKLEEFENNLKIVMYDHKQEKFETVSDYGQRAYDNPERTYLEEIQRRQDMNLKGEEIFTGYPTHYLDIDQHFDGFQKGHFTIIGARPGVGKTTFALNLALHQCLKNKLKVGFFSLEMTGLEISKKFYCINAGVNQRRVDKGKIAGDDFQKMVVSFNEVKNNPLFLDSTSNISMSSLRHKIKYWVEVKGVQIVFVDYLQLISAANPQSSKYEQITLISQTLKVLAKECNIPIISLAQINRESTKGVNAVKPKASELRDSGALEQDADEIFLLHQDTGIQDALDVLLVKNRFGSTGEVKLKFDKATGQIQNLANPWQKKHEKLPEPFKHFTDRDND